MHVVFKARLFCFLSDFVAILGPSNKFIFCTMGDREGGVWVVIFRVVNKLIGFCLCNQISLTYISLEIGILTYPF